MTHRTISELLAHASLRLQDAGVDDPLFEAQLLLAHALRVGRSRVLAMLREPLPAVAREEYESYIRRRAGREPTAYIIGRREFYGLELAVTPAVLIPRPETELLVDVAREALQGRSRANVADVGTGSGAIAIAVATSAPMAQVAAFDSSREALGVAAANARAHHVAERVHLVHAEYLGNEEGFDVVMANLPYVSESDWPNLEPEVRDWEPRSALVGGPSGTETIERFLHMVAGRVSRGGVIAAELGIGQAVRLEEVGRACFPGASIRVRTDLAGIDRVLEIQT